MLDNNHYNDSLNDLFILENYTCKNHIEIKQVLFLKKMMKYVSFQMGDE